MRAVILGGAMICFAGLVMAFPEYDDGKSSVIESVAPKVKCSDPASVDQDDMCIWVHPTDLAQSLVIASDKKAHKLFAYDLDGRTRQTIDLRHPGNIDLRYAIPVGQHSADLVAVNLRDDRTIAVFRVESASRRLERVDDGSIRTGENYGGTLYRSPKSGKLYFFTTSKVDDIEQIELADDGSGKIGGKKVRSWRIGKSEAAVADDEAGRIFIGEEEKGIWSVGGEPDDQTPGQLVVRRGENGLNGDIEGLAIYHVVGGGGYLLVSNQGRSNFQVYQRAGDHRYVGTFAVEGARSTDGIDVCNANLGSPFPNGLFACHTDDGSRPVLLVDWKRIAESIRPGLTVSTVWNRRLHPKIGEAGN